jgi:hypothetical protein
MLKKAYAQGETTHVHHLADVFEEEVFAVQASIKAFKNGERIEELLTTYPDFRCSISMKLMLDPVVTEDGQTYEEWAILQWFETCRSKGSRVSSPNTGATIGTRLIKNISLRNSIFASMKLYELE